MCKIWISNSSNYFNWKRVFINHFGAIIINRKAKIGKNCNIAPSTTIGQANLGKLKGYPSIGDKVWIGTGVGTVGNIQIGNNVLIAPNSFVNIDVPDNSLVLGNPAKVIAKHNTHRGIYLRYPQLNYFGKHISLFTIIYFNMAFTILIEPLIPTGIFI
ncbi:serine O-acetyltransferase [Hwangdonia sp.]|uniref:serine O-acetyltransferase n=1 Tax=Hwangdonia sp. TaxID=1883432 RepID=UPI003AB20D77